MNRIQQIGHSVREADRSEIVRWLKVALIFAWHSFLLILVERSIVLMRRKRRGFRFFGSTRNYNK